MHKLLNLDTAEWEITNYFSSVEFTNKQNGLKFSVPKPYDPISPKEWQEMFDMYRRKAKVEA